MVDFSIHVNKGVGIFIGIVLNKQIIWVVLPCQQYSLPVVNELAQNVGANLKYIAIRNGAEIQCFENHPNDHICECFTLYEKRCDAW